VRIHSYVLMPNHYHVQMKLGVAPARSRAMHWLNTGYGIWFNRRFGRVGALKRAEKQSEPLEKSCLTQRREILRDYEWSSYRAYAGLVEAPKWLSLEEVRERSGLSQRKYPPRTGSAYQ
jgi:putative transposase